MTTFVYRLTYAFGILLLGVNPVTVYAQAGEATNFKSVIIGIAILILAAVVFLLIRSHNRQGKDKDQEVKQKINELRSRGQELHVNREETLTPEDEQILKKYVQHTTWAALIVLGILGLVFIVFMEGIGIIVGIILLVLIYPIRMYLYKDLERALQEGKKHVIRGIITDRFTTTTGSHKSRTTHYWIMLGEHKFEVTSSKYSAYALGDAAEFHTTDYPKGKAFILRDEKLEGAGLR